MTIISHTVTKNRFNYVLRCLRFDDAVTRVKWKAADKFALTRKICILRRKNNIFSEYISNY